MSAKKKKSWFEALCTMDERPQSKKNSRSSAGKTSRNDTSRVRVSSRAAKPYPDDDLPPFDDTPSEPINTDAVLGKPKKTSPSTHPSSSRARSTTSKSTAAAHRRNGAKSSRSTTHAKKQNKPLPAEIAYRMQPYLALFFGALLGIMLLLSAVISGGSYDFTVATHPFRWVGYHVERLLFGMIGYGAFLMPAVLVYLAVERIREGKEYTSRGRGFVGMGILVLLPTIIHTCMINAGSAGGALETWSIKELYTLGADKLGGGVVGGLLGRVSFYALGIIGTLIVDCALMLVLLMLFFGVTPRSLWNACCEWRDARAARVSEYRDREREKPVATSKKEEPLMLAESAYTARPAKQDKRKQKEIEKPSDSDENATYLDPTQALLAQGKKQRKKERPATEADDPYSAYDMPAFGQATDEPAPIEAVNELSRQDIEAMERAYAAGSSVAKVLDAEEEKEEDILEREMVSYPDRAEIDLDAPDATVSPLELPVEDGGVEIPEEIADYQDGFDYSMESAENEDVVDGAEVIGGVTVQIERLSEDEKSRGEVIAQVKEELPKRKPYVYPTPDLLNPPKPHNAAKEQEIRAKMQKLHATLTNFKVRVEGMSYVCGPSVTRYEVRPAPGVRVRSIANLADDIAMSLAAKSIRIEAPIPGKEAVGIEVPNATRETVYLSRLIDSDDFRGRSSKLTACLGEDVAGNPILFDIVKMPHLLVAGTTGSGKSVCINDFIMSLVYKSTPDEVKIILIDPKQVEFTVYQDMPHLMAPIVCDPKRAAAVLNLAVLEMEKRFQMIRSVGVRDIMGYNAITENDRYEHPYMPQIVIIIDELADLMMQAKDEVETAIVRLAQKARAAGMHLIIGTQRPSVDVITGLIKANVPSRIACTVVSQVDSRTILDMAGAEKLLGMGDMLYAPVGSPKPLRVQGAFVSDQEVERIVDFVKRNNDPVRYDQEFLDNLDREAQMIGQKRTPDMDDEGESADGQDPKFYEALRIAVDNNRISTSLLQRMLSIGYGRAAKIIDEMERMGFVGPAVGNKPREIRITKQAYAELIMNKED